MEGANTARGSLGGMLAGLLAMLFLLGPVALQGVQAHEGASSPLFETAGVVLAPYSDRPSVTIDGHVESGEYNSFGAWTDVASGFTAHLMHDNDSLYVALANPAPGWMAIGFTADLDLGMGFVVVGRVNNTLAAVPRLALNVSNDLVFSPADSAAMATIEALNLSQEGGTTVAELKLAMNSTLWSFGPGELVPTIVAFGRATDSLPTGATGTEVHFLRTYPLRPQDNPAEIRSLFMKAVSPTLGLVAVGVMGVGVTAILATFVRRRRSV